MNRLHSPALEQKEDAKHGEIFFPVKKYITKLVKDYPVVTTHWHEEAEIILITGGKCIFQVDLARYEVEEGEYHLTYKPKNKLPVEEFMKLQGRFKHCFQPGNEWTIEEAQKYVDKKWEELLEKCN